jgi:hypothetical protein
MEEMMAFILLCLFIQQSLQKEKSKVFFSKEISSEKMIQLFEKLEIELKGKVGLKVHTGEENGKYCLRPDFLDDIYHKTNGTFIECNAAYNGGQDTTEKHEEILKKMDGQNIIQ